VEEVIHKDETEKDSLVRIHIHKDLELELQYWKDLFEKKAGYDVSGGRPIVSKFLAEILKQIRTKEGREKKHIVIELRKIPRTGKCKVSFL
jgi:hypothetical protein